MYFIPQKKNIFDSPKKKKKKKCVYPVSLSKRDVKIWNFYIIIIKLPNGYRNKNLREKEESKNKIRELR